MRNPSLLQRLHRAAAEIEGQARSRARHPSQLGRMMTGAALNWPFAAGDLLHILQRNGIGVYEVRRVDERRS